MLSVHDERKTNVLLLVTLVTVVLSQFVSTKVWSQTVGGIISRIGDTTHLEFRGRKEWAYTSPHKDSDAIIFTVPAFDDATLIQLQSWKCPLIKDISVNKNAVDDKFEVTIHTTSSGVESFDYLTDDPSYLVIDFYNEPVKPIEPTVKANSGAKTKKYKFASKKLPEKIKLDGDDYTKIDRKPAGSETLSVAQSFALPSEIEKKNLAELQLQQGVFDGGDPNYDRFKIKDYEKSEAALILSKQNVYIHFPVFAEKLNRYHELLEVMPKYEIKPSEEIENKEARFLLTLFTKQRWGAYFATLKYFVTKHPKSKYDEIIKNMTAEAHIHLYERDRDPSDLAAFRSQYQYLVETYPDSVLTERNMLLLAYSSLEEKNGAEAIQEMTRYLAKYPNSDEVDRGNIALAEAYMMLSKPDDAIATYNVLVKGAKDKKYAVEADYRIADVEFVKKNYQRAIDQVEKVQKKYPEYKGLLPSAQYNMSESQFWLGQYDKSLNNYIEFLRLFPKNEQSGCAIARVGEILEMYGADKEKVSGAFMEGYFRFPKSPGSEISRIRMLTNNLNNMNDREKKRAMTEIDEITKKSTLNDINEFTTLKKSDGLAQRKENQDSLNLLLDYYHAHPETNRLPIIKSRIRRNIADILNATIDDKKYVDALSFYGKYSTTWLKNSNRIDTQYYNALAFEKAGVPAQAQKQYADILNYIKKIEGSSEDKMRKVYEHPVTTDQVNLRLAATLMQERKYRDAFSKLNEIKSVMSNTDEIEKIQIGAVVAEQMGDIKHAILYLEKLMKNSEKDTASVAKSEIELTRLYLADGRLKDAEFHIAHIESMKDNGIQISDELWAKTLEIKGDFLLRSGENLASVETYTKLLDSYETKFPLSSIRYKAGKILFDMGDLKGAEKIWQALQSETGEIYKKIALEKLNQAEWSDTYKKYIDRIPAAQGLK